MHYQVYVKACVKTEMYRYANCLRCLFLSLCVVYCVSTNLVGILFTFYWFCKK